MIKEAVVGDPQRGEVNGIGKEKKEGTYRRGGLFKDFLLRWFGEKTQKSVTPARKRLLDGMGHDRRGTRKQRELDK